MRRPAPRRRALSCPVADARTSSTATPPVPTSWTASSRSPGVAPRRISARPAATATRMAAPMAKYGSFMSMFCRGPGSPDGGFPPPGLRSPGRLDDRRAKVEHMQEESILPQVDGQGSGQQVGGPGYHHPVDRGCHAHGILDDSRPQWQMRVERYPDDIEPALMESFRNIPANRSVPAKRRPGREGVQPPPEHPRAADGRQADHPGGRLAAAPASTHHSAASTQRLG